MNRFFEYISVPTQSCNDNFDNRPSTGEQFALANLLVKQMNEIGLEDVYLSDKCYVYGHLSATPGYENRKCIAFISHLDTSPDFSGTGVKPQIIENYDGGDVVLGSSGLILSPVMFPDLETLKGRTLITTDGTTLLGADDKAGIAIILDAVETIIKDNIPHGRISVCFTPDEEIGSQADNIDLERLNADYGITVDGDGEDELNYQTFNAANAVWEINGLSVHPGSAKNIMINAFLVACAINGHLPADEIPAKTEGYEGFFHLLSMSGNVSHVKLNYLIRDHSKESFLRRKEKMLSIEKIINEKYKQDIVHVEIKDTYYNMLDVMKDNMEIIELIKDSMIGAGLVPNPSPVRGGTDGSALSFRGLPCPNIGTGGHAFHGPYEHITLEGMAKATEVVINIIKNNNL